MPVYQTTVESVTQRVITTRDGRNSTIYDILDGAGTKWSTFKQPVANEANRLIGHPVELIGRIEKNDRGYENNYLDDVRLATGAQQRQAEQPRGSYAPADRAMQAQQPERPQQQSIPKAVWAPDEKDWSIFRQVAAKVSAQISSTPEDFWENLPALVTYFAYGFFPPEYGRNAAAPDIHEPIPQERFLPAGYVDPGPEPGKPGPDQFDDLPF